MVLENKILKYEYMSPEIKSYFEELQSKEKKLDERGRMKLWINTAEEFQKKGQYLFSVQCYLKLVEINPEKSLDNVSWDWIKNTWVGSKGVPKNQEGNWVYISSKDKKIL